MSLLLIFPEQGRENCLNTFRAFDSDIDITLWPETTNPEVIDFIAIWGFSPIDYSIYPNLQCVASLGAGAEHILQNPTLPKHVPVVRVVDPEMRQQMTEYIVLAVLNHRRYFFKYWQQKQEKHWSNIPLGSLENSTVGIMGVGSLGLDAALKLKQLGLPVVGWCRSPKTIEGIEIFCGKQQLDSFLAKTNILICLLPLTAHTKNILNQDVFNKLPKGAYVVNVARGNLLVEEDLIKAIDSKQLSGACLDVFCEEPLPQTHPFWTHPDIMITPHNSSNPIIKNSVKQTIENYYRLKNKEQLLNLVDRDWEY